MSTYGVVIRATITKTEIVEADNEDDAVEAAHEKFNILCDGSDESFDQDYLSIEKMEG